MNVSKRFVLLHEAISGTMSNFFMARDLQTGQIVGLKMLDPQKTAAFEARFKGLSKPSEGEIATQLKHPNIVETPEYGLTSEGAHYLVMEYLEGPNVNAALAAHDPCFDRPPRPLHPPGRRGDRGRPPGRLHPPRHLPAQLPADQQPRGPEADRLRPDGAGHAVVHAAGQPHRHAQLHGPGAGPPPTPRTSGSTCSPSA